MSRYIDADWIIQKLERWRGQLAETYGENDEYVLCLGEVLMKLDDAPTADVRENVHAKKVIEGGERDGSTCWFECSHCHGTVDLQDMFCKHCGAVLEYEK